MSEMFLLKIISASAAWARWFCSRSHADQDDAEKTQSDLLNSDIQEAAIHMSECPSCYNSPLDCWEEVEKQTHDKSWHFALVSYQDLMLSRKGMFFKFWSYNVQGIILQCIFPCKHMYITCIHIIICTCFDNANTNAWPSYVFCKLHVFYMY